MTKNKEREQARNLRKSGLSMAEIVKELGVAKSSVSSWTQDIVLTYEQSSRLKAKQKICPALQQQGAKNKAEAKAARDSCRAAASSALISSQDPTLFAFAALYWGEGIKNKNTVAIGTSDPSMLRFFVTVLREKFNVPDERLHLSVQLHPGLSSEAALDFWKSALAWTFGKIHQVRYVTPNSSKQVTDHRCPHGTARVELHDTKLRAAIEGMIDVVKGSTLPLS